MINNTSYQKLFISILTSILITACGSQNSARTEKLGPPADKASASLILTSPVISKQQAASELPLMQKNKMHRNKLSSASRRNINSSFASKTSPNTATVFFHQLVDSDENSQANETYAHYKSNSVKQTSVEPVSTFSVDVDTGSYSNVRRLINNGTLPLKDTVRVEEMLNYFNYNYDNDNNTAAPFVSHTEVAPSPWSKGHHLLQVGIKAVDITEKALAAANLVFLIDVSGSMSSPQKLGFVKKSLSMLVSKMRKEDSIALVVYAGASGIVLEPTSGDEKQSIINAINRLTSGGSTNGSSGIRLAYQVAKQAYIKKGINRILLATDGDFNVGTVNFNQLINLVEEQRKTGISLSTLGFGSGNYNDQLMEQLADAANGQYSYIDTLKEAQKVLIDELSSSLKTVAKDVKIQIEFNPSVVSEYRLIGYENRTLSKEDFNNDRVDAGDIGAGHTVTAFYEIVLSGKTPQIEPLKYQSLKSPKSINSNELAFIKIRYKSPELKTSKLISNAVHVSSMHDSIDQSSNDFRFASSVIAFAGLLKGGQYQQDFNYDDVIKLSSAAKGEDRFGYRSEFIQLVNLTKTLNMTARQ